MAYYFAVTYLRREHEHAHDERDPEEDDEVEEGEEERLLQREAVLLAQPLDVHAIQDVRDRRLGVGGGGGGGRHRAVLGDVGGLAAAAAAAAAVRRRRRCGVVGLPAGVLQLAGK